MKSLVKKVAAPYAHVLEEVDISNDRDLESRYGSEIPVLVIDGKKAAKYRIDRDVLLRLLNGRQDEVSGTGGPV